VHAQSHLFLTSYGSIRAAANLGIPSVVTVHGFSANRGLIVNGFQRVYLNTIGRDLLHMATVVHCLSKQERSAVLELQPKANTIVIPNGVDTAFFKPAKSKDENLVAWVGRMVPEKGLEYLLRALSMISRDFKDLNMVLVGGGPLFSHVVEYVRRHDMESNCHVVGWLQRRAVAEVLGRSSIFVLPSLSEGMPYALLEAMACGDAPIVSALPTICEVVEDKRNGILVPPRDSGALAEQLAVCLSDRSYCEKIGTNARNRIERSYQFEQSVERLSSVYAGMGGS
jgi:glycosyltransferase involved in cell wall biosynthesis